MRKRETAEQGSESKGRTHVLPWATRGDRDERSDDTAFYLVFVEPPGDLQYRDYALRDSPATLGREQECTIAIERSELSRRHAKLTRRGASWVLQDLDSTNGTFVEDRRVTTEQVVEPGVRFRLANCEFKLLQRGDPDLLRYRRFYADRTHDELTELPNASAFTEALKRSRSESGAVTLVFFEIDEFQRLNSELGRDQGDRILKDVVQKLELRLKDEQLYRHSGARFALIRTDAIDIESEIQRLLDGVRRGIAATGLGQPISLSAGIASEDGSSGKQLISAAEHAVLRAKRLGGGSVSMESASPVERPSVPMDPEDLTSHEIQLPILNYSRHSLRAFQEIVKQGASLFAVDLAERQVLAMTNARLFEKLERSLDRVVRAVVQSSPQSKAVTVGEGLNGHPIYVALEGASSATATRLASDIERAFQAECRSRDIEGRMLKSRVVLVTSPIDGIVEATRALGAPHLDTRSMLPLPIGHALRMADDAGSSEQKFFSLNRLHQAITRWLFAVFAAELVRLGSEVAPSKHPLDEVLHKPVTDRAWVMLASEYVDALEGMPRERLVLPAYLEMVTAQGREVIRELEDFATVRNKFAHGQDVRARGIFEEWSPRFRAMLSGPLAALGDHPVRFVERVEHIDENVFDIHFRNLVGDNLAVESVIDRRAQTQVTGRIIVDGGERGQLGLSPFVIYLKCPTCHTEEAFFLDQLQPGPVYKSLRDGAHVVKRLSDAGVDPRFAEPLMAALDRALVTL